MLPDSVHVRFYQNATGDLPGVLLAERLEQSYNVVKDVQITVDPPVVLGPGTYWVSVQARLDFGHPDKTTRLCGLCEPSARTLVLRTGTRATAGKAAARRFSAARICYPQAQEPDQVYRLRGTTGHHHHHRHLRLRHHLLRHRHLHPLRRLHRRLRRLHLHRLRRRRRHFHPPAAACRG